MTENTVEIPDLRVLVVDDSRSMRHFIMHVLNLSGLPVSECLEAANGVEALELLRKRPFDLVLTDINMPVMDGEELVRQIEEDPALRSIPVIVVSTDTTRPRVDRLVSLGAKGYLQKPFLPEELRTELCKVVQRHD